VGDGITRDRVVCGETPALVMALLPMNDNLFGFFLLDLARYKPDFDLDFSLDCEYLDRLVVVLRFFLTI
jgi:hypothetical protein